MYALRFGFGGVLLRIKIFKLFLQKYFPDFTFLVVVGKQFDAVVAALLDRKESPEELGKL